MNPVEEVLMKLDADAPKTSYYDKGFLNQLL
jgi:hypothetical protein